MLASFDDIIEILLQIPHLVGEEAQRVMNREVLGIGEILVHVGALAIEFSDDDFGFDLHRKFSSQCA